MPGGRKKLWRLFEEVEGDFTKVKCLVGGCPSVISRGPTGTARSKLNSSGMTNHAKAKHPEDYNEVKTETLISENAKSGNLYITSLLRRLQAQTLPR